MTLTREALLEKAKPKTELVDVEGWGKVLLRTTSEVQRSRRYSKMFDGRGKRIAAVSERRRVYAIIDQVLTEAGEPMFTDADAEALGDSNADVLEPLYVAIASFNEVDEKKDEAESTES